MTPEEEAKVQEWLKEHLVAGKVDPNNLTAGQWLQISRVIPCQLRCWRIGAPVDVKPGSYCPECGRFYPKTSRYELLVQEDS